MDSRPAARRLLEPDMRSAALRLMLISFLSLYFELTLIRWIPTQIRLLAYFTNFVLIAALLGLGVGMLLAGRRWPLDPYFPVALLVLALAVVALEHYNFVLPIVTHDQFVWGYVYHLPAAGVLAYLILVALFLLMVGVFVFIGQGVGRALSPFTPLAGYSLNIGGSLLGVLGFALANRLETPPTLWFACGAIGFLIYRLPWGQSPRATSVPGVTADRGSTTGSGAPARPETAAGLRATARYGAVARRLLLVGLPLAATIAVIHIDAVSQPAGVSTYWSPYYKVQVAPQIEDGHKVGYNIAVNKDALQFPHDLSGRFHFIPYIAAEEHQYNLVYHQPFWSRAPRHILVLGAGTGNDVAAALRNTRTATVDAVEIDPVVADLGRKFHPEHPYSNPRVHVHVTDARSFLQQTTQKYDLILFGKLDSHRVFSHMSSVRMDNYVYTRENMQTVRRHLAPGGLVALGFVVHEKWIADRLFTLLNSVFGHPPLVYQTNKYAFDTLFFTAKRPLHIPPGAPTISHQQFTHDVLRGKFHETWLYSNLQGFVHPSEFSTHSTLLSDDWPYLYMRDRAVPPNYLLVLVLTVIVSVFLVWLTVPGIDLRRLGNWNFLLLGAGFALQETKGITDIALLFGSTWITNIIVISAILVVILLANLAVSRVPNLPIGWVYLALFAALLFNFVVPLRGLLEYGFWVQVAASGLRVAGPLFFSGIIFARWFERTDNPSAALGANLMGAVLGGLVEYSSLVLGLNELYLLALLFYGLSFALTSWPSRGRLKLSWDAVPAGLDRPGTGG